MKAKFIKRKTTNLFSEQQLLLSENQIDLQEFIGFPFSKKALQKQALLKSKEFSDEKRELLANTLELNYALLDDKTESLNNIIALRNQNCFTISTGHQLCLFTGPIYFIYKILHIIKQCDKLNKQFPDLQFVPLYWMASEDHDFEEIKSFILHGKKISWDRESSGAVGRMTMDGINDVKNQLAEFYKNTPNSEVKDLTEKLEGKNYAEAFFKLIHHLFGKYGLLILDADNSNLKKSFSTIIKEEIKTSFSNKEVLKTNKKLLNRNIKPQVNPREVNLFFHSKNKRERIINQNGKFNIGKKMYSEDELIKIVDAKPESFSPNVILRPLYQESILPNLCYVGGLGELNYWLQLKSSFEKVSLCFPLLQARTSIIWIDKITKNKMNSVGIKEDAIFKSTEEITKWYLKKNAENNIDFSKINLHFDQLKKEVTKKTKEIDQSQLSYVGAEFSRMEKQLEGIQSKFEKSIKMKHEKALRTIFLIKENLFPANDFQERSINFLQLCADGKIAAFIAGLLKNIDPFNSDILILTEENEAK